MTVRLLLSILVAVSAGTLLTCLLWPDRTLRKSSWLIRLAVGAGVGLGLSSEIHFLWLCSRHSSPRYLVLADLALLGGLATALWYFGARFRHAFAGTPARYACSEPARSRAMQWALATAFAIALLPAIYAFLSAFYNSPHGQWDAWMSWNLRARFFFRGGEHWRDTFSSLFWGANPEYPVLLPSLVARSWQYAGQETELAPALLAALFTFATVGLTCSSLWFLRSKGQGLLAGLVLLGTPFFIRHGTAQYADVPLSFFVLASIVLLCLHDRVSPQRGGLLVLMGVTAGCAAWSKNEGLLFLVSLILAAAAVLSRRRVRTAYVRHQLAFTVGLLVVLPVALYAKLRLAPADPMLHWQVSTLQKLVDWQRYGQILKAFGREILEFGNWPVQLTPLLVFYSLLLGIDVEQLKKSSSIIAMGSVGLTLGGYFCVYLITPYDVAWHLHSSLQRLLLQLWPSAVFLFFLLVKTPEQALSGDSRDLASQPEIA